MGRMNKTIKFGTKATTLEKLQGVHLKYSTVDSLYKFSVGQWKNEEEKILKTIKKLFSGTIIIRSSAYLEDQDKKSYAGHFTSLPKIATEFQDLKRAIETVIKKYNRNLKNQIFVQKFFSPVEMSGVIFTRGIDNLSPYITINYDSVTGKTNTITSGVSNSITQKTFVIFRDYEIKKIKNRNLRLLCLSANELEKIFNNDSLDIEFLIKNSKIHILQVRPLTIKTPKPDTKVIADVLKNISHHLREFNLPHSDLHGQKNLYGIMPDWNPAEMIGVKPKPLSLSLYRELITDSIWAFQRDNYGYKKLRSFPLLISLAGSPYIDLRVDFNSFIPKALNESTANKLANFYLAKLRQSPASHDKIEFDIVYSCYTPDLPQRLSKLKAYNFSEAEIENIKNSLLNLTNNIISPHGLYQEDLKKIKILEQRLKKVQQSKLSVIRKIYWITEDCKRYGTLPFAGIARAAFIATQLLNSIVKMGILSTEDEEEFLKSLDTITEKLSRDTKKLFDKKVSREKFLETYGHLRPGTYDILSDNYKKGFEKYFSFQKTTVINSFNRKKGFCLSKSQYLAINTLLRDHEIKVDAKQLFQFIAEVIRGRESAKFSFTKNINAILELIKQYGSIFNFRPEEMAYIEIGTLLKLHSAVGSANEKQILADEIARNRATDDIYHFIQLPSLISQPNDLYQFFMDEIQPNYITAQKTTGSPIIIHHQTNRGEISEKIVCIENADPGFDWIFSHNIRGLITAYGGANSHMTIRAAELNLPAVIGCGPILFEKWSRAQRLEIDALNKKTTILS